MKLLQHLVDLVLSPFERIADFCFRHPLLFFVIALIVAGLLFVLMVLALNAVLKVALIAVVDLIL